MAIVRRLVLASTSRYRRELLERLRLVFECASPGVDESAHPAESPAARAWRLAEQKARALAANFPDAILIGSDQVASIGDDVLDKPGRFEVAVEQLRRLSGRTARFDTAVTLHDTRTGYTASRLVVCEVDFRTLDEQTIESYLRAEEPYDCAASAKAEGLGIALIRAIRTDDPTSLIGLPLIAVTELLAGAGVSVFPGLEPPSV